MELSKKRCDYEKYVERFYTFLDERNLSRTMERNDILRIVFKFNKHFTISELDKKLKEHKCRVSKSALYSTIEILKDAGMVLKHHLPWSATPIYEKFYDTDAHSHIYVENTEEVIEFYNPQIDDIKREVAESFSLDVINHTLTLYCRKRK